MGDTERTNDQIDADIRARAHSVSFADELTAQGLNAVVLSPEGVVVVKHPDGSFSELED